jgi:hypothetical protein
MKMQPSQKIIGPHRPHDVGLAQVEDGIALTLRDSKHTPWNKVSGTVDSQAELQIQNGEDWVSVRLEETTKGESGRLQSRTISVSMSRAAAECFANHILTGSRKYS